MSGDGNGCLDGCGGDEVMQMAGAVGSGITAHPRPYCSVQARVARLLVLRISLRIHLHRK